MLKKSAIALAVAAAIAAPMAQAADSTVYGKVEAKLTSQKDQDLSISEYARIGVKGGADTNNGMKAGYKVEFNVNTADAYNEGTSTGDIGLRHANVFLSGGFGTLTAGRGSNPYADTYVADQFEKFTGDFQMAPWRYGNSLVWTSNDMGGMDFYAGAAMDDQGIADPSADMDAMVFGFNGDFGGVGVHVGIINVNEDGVVALDETLTSIGVDYTMGKIYLAGNLETASEAEITAIELAAMYDVSSTTKVGLGFATCDGDDVANTTCGSSTAPLDEETRITAGGYFDLSNGVSSWAEFGSKSEADTNYVQVGMRVKF